MEPKMQFLRKFGFIALTLSLLAAKIENNPHNNPFDRDEDNSRSATAPLPTAAGLGEEEMQTGQQPAIGIILVTSIVIGDSESTNGVQVPNTSVCPGCGNPNCLARMLFRGTRPEATANPAAPSQQNPFAGTGISISAGDLSSELRSILRIAAFLDVLRAASSNQQGDNSQ